MSTHTMEPPQTGLYRVLISSEARQHLDELKRRNTVKHLSHSANISETYYEFMNTADATEAHANIRALSVMRRWTRKEVSWITSQWPLSAEPPTMTAIQNVLKQDKDITRTA